MTKARCTPLWQPIPCPLSDIEGLESWLGDMAAQGLVPVTIGQNFARFRCSPPWETFSCTPARIVMRRS